MWLSLRFLHVFPAVNSFVCSFSLVLLRVQDTGCHTLLSPQKNCDLSICVIFLS